MKVQIHMSQDDEFYVNSWFANSPDFVIETLTKQLVAAAAVWPELRDVHLTKDSEGDKFMRALGAAK